MESKFTHYLITRFNVRIEGYGPEYFPSGVRTTSWEYERLPLFEKYCAPSVAGQRSGNFTWLIYCDTLTAPGITERIRKAIEPVSSVRVHFVGDFQEMISHIRDICASSGTPFVITSRLDNDDAIGLDYIRILQENFEPSGNVLLNLSGGMNYNITSGVLTHHPQSLNNSFISLIEEVQAAEPIKTVYGFKHLSPPHTITIKNIQYAHAFWMNLHAQNAGARKNRGWPALPGNHLRHYAIDQTYIHLSMWNTVLYAARWFPTALIKKFKFILRRK